MTYYKVKPEADQTPVRLVYKTQILVKDEIYTQREIERAAEKGFINKAFINKHFVQKQINPKNTYYFFGARFETK